MKRKKKTTKKRSSGPSKGKTAAQVIRDLQQEVADVRKAAAQLLEQAEKKYIDKMNEIAAHVNQCKKCGDCDVMDGIEGLPE